MTPEEIGSGTIQGGWPYIWASYALTWCALVGYSMSLWWRARGEESV